MGTQSALLIAAVAQQLPQLALITLRAQVLLHNHGNKNTERHFKFTGSAGPEIGQGDFFRTSGVPNLLEATLEGYSCTCFAYGQTGSGKTYTLSGEAETGREEHNEGVTRQALRYLYQRAEELRGQACKVAVRASYCEVYNEQVFDLLTSVDTSSDMGAVAAPLQVRGGKRGFFADGITIAECESYSTAAAVLHRGHAARRVRSHRLNEHSSRSHSLFTLEVEVTRPAAAAPASTARSRRRSTAGADSVTHSGKVVFVDLAGSERLKRSGAAGDGRKETGAINKSLFALAKVISAVAAAQQAAADAEAAGPADPSFDELMAGKLRKRRQSNAGAAGAGSPRETSDTADKARGSSARPATTSSYIPYRDSTLTKLLMNSLGGDSRTLMIACVSPAHVHLEESLNTLAYAQRAAKIRNSAVLHTNAGKVGGAAQGIISNLKAEIQQLRAENAALKGGAEISPSQYSQHSQSPYGHPGVQQPPSPAAFGVLSPQQQLLDERMRQASPAAHRPAHTGLSPDEMHTGHMRAPAQHSHSEPPRAAPRGALQMDSDVRVSAVTQAAGMSVLNSGRGDNARRGGPNGPRRAPLKRSISALPSKSKKLNRAGRAAAAAAGAADPPSTAPSGEHGKVRRSRRTTDAGQHEEGAPPAIAHGRRSVAFQEHGNGAAGLARKLPAPTPITSPAGSPSRGAAGEGFAPQSPTAGPRGGGHRRSSCGSAFSPDGSSPVAGSGGKGKPRAKHGRRSSAQHGSPAPDMSPVDAPPAGEGALTPAQLDALIAEEMHKVQALKTSRGAGGKPPPPKASSRRDGAEGHSTPTRQALAEKRRLQRENQVLRERVKEAKATARTARGTRIPKLHRKEDGSAAAGESPSPVQASHAPPQAGPAPQGMQLPPPMPYHPGQAAGQPFHAAHSSHGMAVPQLPLMSPGPDAQWSHAYNAQAPMQWSPPMHPAPPGHMHPGVHASQPFSPAGHPPFSQPQSHGPGATPHPGKVFDFNVPLSPAARGEVQHPAGGAPWSNAPGLGVGVVGHPSAPPPHHLAPAYAPTEGSVYSAAGGSVDYAAFRLGTADTMGSLHTAHMELVPPSSTPVPPHPAPTPLPREHNLYGHPAGVGAPVHGSGGLTAHFQQPVHADPLARWQGSFKDGAVAESLAVQATTSMGSFPHGDGSSGGSSPNAAAAIARGPSPVPLEVGSPINAGRLTPRGGQRPPSSSSSSVAQEQAAALQRKLDAMARREMHLLARMDTLERNIASPAASHGASSKASPAGGVWVDSGRVIAGGGEDADQGQPARPGGVGSPASSEGDESDADDSSPVRPGHGAGATDAVSKLFAEGPASTTSSTEPTSNSGAGGDGDAESPAADDDAGGDGDAESPAADDDAGGDGDAESPAADDDAGGDGDAESPAADDDAGGDGDAESPAADDDAGGDGDAESPAADDDAGGDGDAESPAADDDAGGDGDAESPAADDDAGGDGDAESPAADDDAGSQETRAHATREPRAERDTSSDLSF